MVAFMGLCDKVKRCSFVVFIGLLLVLLNWHWPIDELWTDGQLVGDANYIFTLSFSWWLVATYLVWRYPAMAKAWNEGIVMRAIAGILTLVPLWLALNTLRSANYEQSTHFGSMLILVVLGIVWSADIGAYFTGKNFGKHKLMPKVSPNKTIEGLAGGVVAAVIFVLAFCHFTDVDMSVWPIYAIMTMFIALFSAIGDLLESMFKREAGLKDSGSCLPGHGGILDRLDSLTAAAPIFVLCYAWTLSL